MTTLKTPAVIVLLLATATSFGWNDISHAVIANLAYEHLKPNVKAKINRLLTIGVESKFQSLPMASVWADEIRSRKDGPWHYRNEFFRADGQPTTNRPNEENVVWAIEKMTKSLSNKSASDSERAIALRYLIHFVADVHQPLHTVARVTKALPDGDRGGNEFLIRSGNGITSNSRNLHQAWDSGCGAFYSKARVSDARSKPTIDRIISQITREQKAILQSKKPVDLTVTNWSNEGVKIAKQFVYTTRENQAMSKQYVAKAQKICRERAALASMRLAALLNKILAD